MESKGDGVNYNCRQCSKNVKDLTSLDIEHLANSIENEQNTCVKIKQNQLFGINRFLKKTKIATLASIIAIGSTSCNKNIILKYKGKSGQIKEIKHRQEYSSNQIHGKIIEIHYNSPVFYGQITIEDTEVETFSDLDGNFSLEIPTDIKDDAIVHFTYVGYKTIKIELAKIKGKEILVSIGESPELLGYLELKK